MIYYLEGLNKPTCHLFWQMREEIIGLGSPIKAVQIKVTSGPPAEQELTQTGTETSQV